MKRLVTLIAALAVFQTYAQRIEATLPSPDAKAIGMGGLMMTTLSGSHAIYNNSAMAVFSRMPSQISSSYYGQEDIDYYAVSGFCRFDNVNLAQIGWRQYLREHGNNDMAVDLGYSRRMGDNWALGIVARYMHLKRPEISADALAVDLSAAYQLPLENVGSCAQAPSWAIWADTSTIRTTRCQWISPSGRPSTRSSPMRTKSPSAPTWDTISRRRRSADSKCRWVPNTT